MPTDDEFTPIEAIAARNLAGACEVMLWQRPRIDEETGDTMIVFGFRVAAGDMPEGLLYCRPGTRFIMAVVEIDGLNLPTPERDYGLNAIRLSHAMMRDARFRRWASVRGAGEPLPPSQEAKAALEYLYARCDIESRRELRNNRAARDRLYLLNNDFQRSLGRTGWGNPEEDQS